MEMKIRLRAQHIRQQLRSRHNNWGFRDILNNLSDHELVAQADEHHRESIQFALAKKAKQPSERLSSLFQQACHIARASSPKKPAPSVEDPHTLDFESADDDLTTLYSACLKRVESIPKQKPAVSFSFEIKDEDVSGRAS